MLGLRRAERTRAANARFTHTVSVVLLVVLFQPSILIDCKSERRQEDAGSGNKANFGRMSAMIAAAAALRPLGASSAPDISLEIAPFLLEPSPKHRILTLAYNGQVPGPVLRMRQGRCLPVEIRNRI